MNNFNVQMQKHLDTFKCPQMRIVSVNQGT
jgi:hypothetical protein